MTPEQAAKAVVACHRLYSTKGVAISGGEPTINRRWLIEFFRHVTRLVKPKVRRHLDSNGTVLTPDYIDELVEAGCNNIGVEPKCVNVDTYMRITGLADRELAKRYLETAWKAIEYIYEHYGDRVYLGVGLVYNSKLVSLDELAEAGRRIASIDPRIQVTVLDYFPAFRRMDLRRPSFYEMLEVKRVLEEQGLRTVIVQTEVGHIGPGDRKVP
jgi:pyruvate formate lyase activating enzyme